MVKIERAIISVSDKEGIVDFSKKLVDRGVEIISTGGTASLLEKNGIRTRASPMSPDSLRCWMGV